MKFIKINIEKMKPLNSKINFSMTNPALKMLNKIHTNT